MFIQLGATRDGLDPYLNVARARGWETVLIETPAYIQWRKVLGRQTFDHTIAVEHPSSPAEVCAAIAHLQGLPALLLAGFERYTYAAYAIAQQLRIRPYRPGDFFLPLNKAEQRKALAIGPNPVHQPRYMIWTGSVQSQQELKHFSYPYVIKPVDGGGGLGVFLVNDDAEREQAWTELQTLSNYDGGAFQGTLIEQYVPGTEYSVQGIVREQKVQLLTVSQKFVGTESVSGKQGLRGFRELGHIASGGTFAEPEIIQFVQACVTAVGYSYGPFHIDFVRSDSGYTFLEMGFRLSGGGLARLVERVSGYNWAEEVFRVHLDEPRGQIPSSFKPVVTGQVTARTVEELDAAQRLQEQGYVLEIERFSIPDHIPSARSLTSDLSRHTGFTGRITASAETIGDVQQLLYSCLSLNTALEA